MAISPSALLRHLEVCVEVMLWVGSRGPCCPPHFLWLLFRAAGLLWCLLIKPAAASALFLRPSRRPVPLPWWCAFTWVLATLLRSGSDLQLWVQVPQSYFVISALLVLRSANFQGPQQAWGMVTHLLNHMVAGRDPLLTPYSRFTLFQPWSTGSLLGNCFPNVLSDKTSFLPFQALSQPPPALLQKWNNICVWPLCLTIPRIRRLLVFLSFALSQLSFFSKYHSLSSALGYLCSLIFYFKIFYWCIVDLHSCISSRWTAKWISYTYTYIYSFLDSFPI